MIDFSDVTIADHYKNIPPEIKTRLFSDDTNEIIFNICSQNKLSLDQMNMCADEVDLFLLGMTLPESFPKKLSARIETDPELTNHLVDSFNTKIFLPLKESLQALYKVSDIVFPKLTPPQAPNRVLEKGMPPQTTPAVAFPVSPASLPQKNTEDVSSSPVIAPIQPLTPPQPTKPRSIPIVIEKTPSQVIMPPPPAPQPIPPATPAPTPVAPQAPTPQPPVQKSTLSTPFVGQVPVAAIQSAATPSIPPRRPLNWSDILATQHKESNEAGVVHAKLEKALNDNKPTPSNQISAPISYKEKDPYREPIE